MELRKCASCRKDKRVELFYAHANRGYQHVCIACKKEYNRLHYQKNKDKYKDNARKNRETDIGKDKRLRRLYGITLVEWNNLSETQLGMCAVCNKKPHEVVDHDHKSGKARGLLCQLCNKGLGHFSDSVDTLSNAVVYLKKYNIPQSGD